MAEAASCARSAPKFSGRSYSRASSIPRFAVSLIDCLFTRFIPSSYMMFKRQLLRQQRALTQTITRSPQIRRTPFSSISSNAPRISAAFPTKIARRWQSDDASKKPDGAPAEAKPAENTAEDAAKKELEAKTKEIKDLKVGHNSATLSRHGH